MLMKESNQFVKDVDVVDEGLQLIHSFCLKKNNSYGSEFIHSVRIVFKKFD